MAVLEALTREVEVQVGRGQVVSVRVVADRFEIMERAIEARDRAVARLAQDEERMAGRRALIAANVRQDREAALEQALAVTSRKVLTDGRIVDRFAWQAERQLPDPPEPQGPDEKAGESEHAFEERKKAHAQACAGLEKQRIELAEGLSEKERERLASVASDEIVELLLAEEVRMTGARAFAREWEAWTVFRCAMKQGGHEPFFESVEDVRGLPEDVRRLIFEKHEEMCDLEGDLAAPFSSRGTHRSG
jgi:hypothetical protein